MNWPYQEQLLLDIGIPERCPTCTECDWEFRGAVDVGIKDVHCRTCRRHYVRALPWQAAKVWIGQLVSAMDHAEIDELTRIIEELHGCIYKIVNHLQTDERRTFVVEEGEWPGNDDDVF